MLIEVVCDGAARGQGQKKTGEAACGIVVYKNKKEIAKYARGLGKRTNNEAEYEAVITSLLICSMAQLNDPIIYSDSAVVVNQVNGKWQCKNDNLFTLLKSIRIIQEQFRFRIQHVPRAFVHEADKLANIFLNELQKDKIANSIK
jgi:ribonuclease HI